MKTSHCGITQAHNTSVLENNENEIAEMPEKYFFTKPENYSKIWIEIGKIPNSQINASGESIVEVSQ